MAKPGLRTHAKFRRLVYLLGLPAPHVLGHLETMWHTSWDRGSPLLGDATDVELAAEWQGEPGRLADALVSCRFLDVAEHGYAVHAWLEHAPQYVRRRVEREGRRPVNDPPVASQRLDMASQRLATGAPTARHVQSVVSPTDTDTDTDTSSHTTVGGCGGKADEAAGPPPPVGCADPSLFEPLRVYPQGGTPEAADPAGFAAFWEVYPKKTARKAALKAWKKKRIGRQLAARIVEAVKEQKTWRQWREGVIPNPSTWINQERWEDERPPEPEGRGVPKPLDARTQAMLDALDDKE